MKELKIVLLIFIGFISYGCDEGLLPTQIVLTEFPVVETTLPSEVLSAMKIQADQRTRLVARRMAYDGDDEALLEYRQQLIDAGLDTFDFHAAQKAYYTKNIDAMGIAVVGNDEIADKYFLRARDAVHVMTSKHPELKERLLSKHGKFYMILVPYNRLNERDNFFDVPELMLNSVALVHGYYPFTGTCFRGGVTGYCVQKVMRISMGDLCYNGVITYDGDALDVFVHEFAHVLEWEMERLKPGFQERLREAYEAAGGASGTGISSYYEYWAAGVVAWFFMTQTFEARFEKHLLLAELLDEWFPRVSLSYEYENDWTLTYTDDCNSCGKPNLCRRLKAEGEAINAKNQE